MSSTDLAVPDDMSMELDRSPSNLFGTQDPAEVVARSTEIANALSDVLQAKKLAKKISNRSFVLVEGWTLLGTMLGVFPVVVWTRKLEDGWEARVEARTLDGRVVGAAESEVLRSEKSWANRDDYALRSMAQTRATSKALRGPLGFIVTLAGYEATPFEEMPSDIEGTATTPPDVAGPAADGESRQGNGDVEPTGSGRPSAPSPDPERDEAIKNLSAVFANLQDHGSLPPGHENWTAYLRWYLEGKYSLNLDTQNWREELSTLQIRETTAYLMEMEIPFDGGEAA